MKLLFFKHAGSKIKSSKKILVIVAMVALLFVTGFVNYKLSQKTTTTNNSNQIITTSSASFFSTYRTERKEVRNREIEILESIIASPTATAEAKETASTKRFELLATMEKELVLENLIKSAGFDDAVVTTSSENYNCIVKSPNGELVSSDVTKILDIVVNEVKCKASNVKVMSID